MIGRFGEVVLMDWGLAKLMPNQTPSAGAQEEAEPGEFTGTPAYMSPEQAGSRPNSVAPASDIYSATVLFHELLSLRHYLSDCHNVQQLLIAIAWERFAFQRLLSIHHPEHNPPPAELIHFLTKGLAKDPADRYQSVDEMLNELQAIRDGRCRVKCPATLAKRMTNEVGRALGRRPVISMLTFYSVVLIILGCVGVTLRAIVTHRL